MLSKPHWHIINFWVDMMNFQAIHKSSSQGATSSLIWSRVSSHLVNISQIFTFLWLFSGSPTTPEEKLSLAALTMMRVNHSPFHRSAPNLKFCNIYQLSCMCERKCPNHWHKLKPASSLVLSLHNMQLSPCANRGESMLMFLHCYWTQIQNAASFSSGGI